MRRRVGELQIFSLSFLDLLSCGLGGILLLYLAIVTQSKQAADAAAARATSLQAQISQAQSDLTATADSLADARSDQAKLQEANQHLRSAQSALVGLKGNMRNVVFIFDHSGSMKENRFPEYRQLLQEWVRELPFERFNIVMFCDQVSPFQSEMVSGTPTNRTLAVEFIGRFEPEGTTATLEALQLGFRQRGVDTLVLMSDGAPNGGAQGIADVLDWTKANNRGVVINSVAMGNYFNQAYGAFLQQLSQDHGGMFIGR